MRINPSIHFDGRCREAFQKYHRILGGTLQTMLTYGDSPMAAQVEPGWHDRIMHATLLLGEGELTGVDLQPSDYRRPQGFSITINVEGLENASRLFTALAEDGAIKFPFQPTFWSPGYGMLVDEFDIPWEVNCGSTATV